MERKRTLVDEQTVKRRTPLGIGRARKRLQLPIRDLGLPGEVHLDEEIRRMIDALKGADVGVANERKRLALRGGVPRLGLNGRPKRDPGNRRAVDGGIGVRQNGYLKNARLSVVAIGEPLAGDQAAVTKRIARVARQKVALGRRGSDAAERFEKLRARKRGIFLQSGIAEMQGVGRKFVLGKGGSDRAKREKKAKQDRQAEAQAGCGKSFHKRGTPCFSVVYVYDTIFCGKSQQDLPTRTRFARPCGLPFFGRGDAIDSRGRGLFEGPFEKDPSSSPKTPQQKE